MLFCWGFCFFLQCLEEHVYDTDHTDLNSDFDEAELRRELLNDVSFIHIYIRERGNLYLFYGFPLILHSEMASTL